MNTEQMETLNAVQEVLRGVVMALLAANPDQADVVAKALTAFANRPGAQPVVVAMLDDLAKGPQSIADAQRRGM